MVNYFQVDKQACVRINDSIPDGFIRSPLLIETMLVCHCMADPADHYGSRWNSVPAQQARVWLIANELIDAETLRSTEKGAAWVKFICDTPLPKLKWEMGER